MPFRPSLNPVRRTICAAIVPLLILAAAIFAPVKAQTRPGATHDDSVYCQVWPGHSSYPAYPGTGPQTPCISQAQPRKIAPNPGAYSVGFVQGFMSCLGSGALAPFQIAGQVLVDLGIYGDVAASVLRGDNQRAANILDLKGQRDRTNFTNFVNSVVNPNIYGVDPQQAGNRDGFRICSLWVIPSLLKKLNKQPAASTQSQPPPARVFASITPTQPNWQGTIIPRSFTLATPNGAIWVSGNVTEHIAELATGMMNRGVAMQWVNMASELELSSLQQAITEATANGVPYGTTAAANGWELGFAQAAGPGQFPRLIHANPAVWRGR
jgi:hypothetical protein